MPVAMPSLRTPTQSLLLSQMRILRPTAATFRQYHPTGALTSYKDDQDRQSLKPRPSEGTKSGSDYEVAEKRDAAYNPKKTDPAAEKDAAARESNGNPLEASGANQEFSRPQKPEEPTDKSEKKTKSRSSEGKKHGKVAPM